MIEECEKCVIVKPCIEAGRVFMCNGDIKDVKRKVKAPAPTKLTKKDDTHRN